MARILHVSADYPDPLAPAKTRAVSNLLALVTEHEHRVVSLNRVGWRLPQAALPFADAAGSDHRALAYGAPGKGLFLRRFLARVTDWIAADCAAAGFEPDLVHGHKATIDGLVAAPLAARFGVPLALSIQGNTDQKIAQLRPDLRPALGRIWRGADVAFPFAPWAWRAMDELLGRREGPTVPLPCATPGDAILEPRPTEPVVRTAFHLRDHANKNAVALIEAVGRIARDMPAVRLEIVGGGDPAGFAVLHAAAEAQASGRIRLLGPVPHGEVQRLFNGSAAFAMVSHRETYGMVFAEALLAGAPCLIPRGRAIDGYFDDGRVTVAVDPKRPDEIEAGLRRLLVEQDAFKERLGDLGRTGGLDFLRRDAIRRAYVDGLALALGPKEASTAAGPPVESARRLA